MSVQNWVRNSQIWNSIFRHGGPRDRRPRFMAVMSTVFLPLHPVAVRKSGIRLSFTWCMGGLTFFLYLAEVVSGVLLMFYYRPVIEYAYQDIQDLRAHVTLGVLREIHRWGAHAMIIAIWLHMMRVFLTGSYKPPREFNWMVGTILLVLTLLLSFTGYLLPWDQLAIWAITVGSNMTKATPLVGAGGPFSKIFMFPRADVSIIHAASGFFTTVRHAVNWVTQPALFISLSIGVFILMFVFYKWWTRPGVFFVIFLLFLLGYFGSMGDPNYKAIVAKPDNVPITMMV